MVDERWEVTLLEDLGPRMRYPVTPDMASRVGNALARPAKAPVRRGRLRAAGLAAAALLVAAVVTVVVSRDARDAVASFLGLGVAGERIEVAPTPRPGETPSALPSSRPFPSYGERVDRADAAMLAGFEPRLPASLGEPAGYYALLDTQQVIVADYGALQIWEFRLEAASIGKLIGVEGPVEVTPVDVGGAPGYWIRGGKRIVTVANAQGTPVAGTRRVTESNALVWAAGGLYRRIEGAASLEQALGLAAEMR